MLFRIDNTTTVPIYAQLATCVRDAIATGELELGDRLPGARDLAEQLGISLHTVLHAYADLRAEGIVDVRRGRGAIITGGTVRHHDLDALLDQAIALAKKHRAPASYLVNHINRNF